MVSSTRQGMLAHIMRHKAALALEQAQRSCDFLPLSLPLFLMNLDTGLMSYGVV